MSNVSSSSDAAYTSYMKPLSELEHEVRSEAKRNEKRRDERVNELEDKYLKSIRESEKDKEQSIQAAKESSADALTAERRNAREEIDRLKGQMYDRSGRLSGVEAEARQQAKQAQEAVDAVERENDRRAAETERTYQNRLAEQDERHQKELEDQAKSTQEFARDSLSKTVASAKEDYENAKQELEKKYATLQKNQMEEMNQVRKTKLQHHEDVSRDYKHQLAKTQQGIQATQDKAAASDRARAELATLNEKQSRAGELQVLRDQITDLSQAQRQYNRDLAKGREDAIREYESDWRGRLNDTVELYDRQLANMKRHADEADSSFGRLHDSELKERDRFYSKLLAQNTQEAKSREDAMADGYHRNELQNDELMRIERQNSQRALQTQSKTAEENLEATLKGQNEAFRKTLKQQKEQDGALIAKQEKELNLRRNSADPKDMSSAAEANLRDQVTREYERQMNEDQRLTKAKIDSLQSEYAKRLSDVVQETQAKETVAVQASTLERHQERQDLLNHIEETELSKKEALLNNQRAHESQTDRLTRNYQSYLEKQKRDYDELYNQVRNDAALRIQTMRQEADQQSRLERKAFASRQNDLIRTYEKRLSEQREEFEAKLDEMKYQSGQQIRTLTKESKQALEEQQRQFDQRLAQLEQTQREREKNLTENYQDQIEKVRRSTALMAQRRIAKE